jgi:hypothetical protein
MRRSHERIAGPDDPVESFAWDAARRRETQAATRQVAGGSHHDLEELRLRIPMASAARVQVPSTVRSSGEEQRPSGRRVAAADRRALPRMRSGDR